MAITEPAGARRPWALDIGTSLSAALDRAAASHARAVFALVVVALLAFVPGISSISPIDRDEARFAQATKQMLESGNYVDIRFHDQVRYKKPAGIHWLQAASVTLGEAVVGPSARSSIVFYRLPSLFAAIGAVLLTYWAALNFVSRRGALLAGLMMASCVLLGVEARLAKTDAVLLFTTLCSMAVLARVYIRPDSDTKGDFARAAAFWTGLGVGIMVKGPMAPLFLGLPILTLVIIERSGGFLRRLKPLPGLLWCALICLPWFVAIYFVTNGAFYKLAVGVDMLGKVTDGQEGHWGPPGTYLLAMWGTFWPAIALVAMAVPFVWRARKERAVRFLLAWVVPAWIVFEITATKLPHYVLPLYPGLAILAALAIERGALVGQGRRMRDFANLWPILGGLLLIALVVGFHYLGSGLGLAAWPLLALALVLVLLVIAARSIAVPGPQGAFLVAVAGALLLYWGVYGVLLPQMRGVWISQRLAEIVRVSGCPAANVATVPYQEPSLVFLVGTDIKFTDPHQAGDLLKKGGCAIAFIGADMKPLFEAHARDIGLAYRATETVDGFTYNGGRKVSITVYRPAEGKP
ncbi:glycosyltransferase family 39 protein [Xanthobacter sp. DSM 24535]|uniref:ArnT family glycosyltransferase n=1 Tax=Roseixanthobacter psychrophilus TaxID=3119917 RepID=UPI00372A84B6